MSIEFCIPEKLPCILDNDITDYYHAYLSNQEITSFDKLTEISDIASDKSQETCLIEDIISPDTVSILFVKPDNDTLRSVEIDDKLL